VRVRKREIRVVRRERNYRLVEFWHSGCKGRAEEVVVNCGRILNDNHDRLIGEHHARIQSGNGWIIP
jgi:hypothetical protein